MLTLGFVPSISSHESIAASLILGGIGLSGISFLWVCVGVRCTKCRTALVWKAMREQPHDKWLDYLLSNKTCPYCQDGQENEK